MKTRTQATLTSLIRSTLLAFAFTVVAGSATAQEAESDTLDAPAAPGRFGPVIQAVGFGPTGEFRDRASFSLGFTIGGRFFLDRRGLLALYGGGGLAHYGSEKTSILLGLFDVKTYTQMIFVEVGPQIHIGRGPIVPYIHGTVGISNIATKTSTTFLGLEEIEETETDASDTNLAVAGGGGLRIRVRGQLYLDLAVIYQRNGTMTYLVEEEEVTSETDVLRFQVGVSSRW